jgi:hypothetical protein
MDSTTVIRIDPFERAQRAGVAAHCPLGVPSSTDEEPTIKTIPTIICRFIVIPS